MQIYCDGGQKTHTTKTALTKKRALVQTISYGIRVELGGDESVELSGRRTGRTINGLHEQFAFIESVIFADAHNGNTFNTVIYTDCLSLTGMWMLPDVATRLQSGVAKRFRKDLARLDKYYSKRVLELAFDYFLYAKVVWVKGHNANNCIGNMRADHLATMAYESRTPVPFEAWLKTGFAKHDKEIGKHRRVYAAFGNTLHKEKQVWPQSTMTSSERSLKLSASATESSK